MVFICHVCSPVSLMLSGLHLRSCSRVITFVKRKGRTSFIEQNLIRGIQPLPGENSDCFLCLIAGCISINIKIPTTIWLFFFCVHVCRMQNLAKELGVVIPVSFFEEANNAHYNSVAVIDADGTDRGLYRKSHIPDGPGL